MGRGTGAMRDPIRMPSSGGLPAAVADYQSEADEETQGREETKRLVYVALTRARSPLSICDGAAWRAAHGAGSLERSCRRRWLHCSRARQMRAGAEIAWMPAADQTHGLAPK